MLQKQWFPLLSDLQVLVDQESLKIIPDHYIPNISNKIEVPTIDLNKLMIVSPGSRQVDELEKLHSACKEWGIFQLVNHGMSSLMEKLRNELGEFNKLAIEEKMKYKVRENEFEGYGSRRDNSANNPDWCDRLYMITNPINNRKSHLLPELPSSFRNTLESYLMEMQKLSTKLLGVIAKNLKIELKEMLDLFDNGIQSVRITNYPPNPQPDLVMGFRPHTDGTCITILNQVNGVNGLQILKDGIWLPVNFLHGALIINVGDILEIVSNGVYHSVEHKVAVNSEKERISVAFFVNPKLEAEVGPATSLINRQNSPKFKTISMENYLKWFFSRELIGRSNLEALRVTNVEEEVT